MKLIVEIIKDDKLWNNHADINKILVKKVLRNILNRYSNFAKIKNVEIAILLTNNNNIQLLNNKFRKKNKPTNVLSFPDIEINWPDILEFQVDENYMYLGDIAFGYGIIQKEVSEYNKPFVDHFIHLLVHSILHLLGFKHNTDESATVMENIETDVLKSFNITSPYK